MATQPSRPSPEIAAKLAQLKEELRIKAENFDRRMSGIGNMEKVQPIKLVTDKAQGGLAHLRKGGQYKSVLEKHNEGLPHTLLTAEEQGIQGVYPELMLNPRTLMYLTPRSALSSLGFKSAAEKGAINAATRQRIAKVKIGEKAQDLEANKALAKEYAEKDWSKTPWGRNPFEETPAWKELKKKDYEEKLKNKLDELGKTTLEKISLGSSVVSGADAGIHGLDTKPSASQGQQEYLYMPSAYAKGGSIQPMGINVATDRKAGISYADLIVDGHKTYESRNSDTLRPYVGKRVAIVRTGEGPAKAIGEVTIGEPEVVNKRRFRELEGHHMVPEGSQFDINTETKHLYPLHKAERYEKERDVGHGIIARKVIHMDKGGKIEVRPTVFDDAASRRNPKIEAAARALAEGKMKQAAYAKLVAKEKPVKAYDFIPKPATNEQAMDVLLDRQKQNWRSHEGWPAGHRVGLRLDIPAYERHGVWVNSVHDESGGQEKFPTSYGPVSSVRNAEFQGNPTKGIKVATGEQSKAPFAKIMGNLEHIDEEQAIKHMQKYLKHPDYRQVGYDPRRHGEFYDRETMQPITHSEHVVQIGPLVLAKKPVYGKRSLYRQGGKVTHAHHLDIEERPL